MTCYLSDGNSCPSVCVINTSIFFLAGRFIKLYLYDFVTYVPFSCSFYIAICDVYTVVTLWCCSSLVQSSVPGLFFFMFNYCSVAIILVIVIIASFFFAAWVIFVVVNIAWMMFGWFSHVTLLIFTHSRNVYAMCFVHCCELFVILGYFCFFFLCHCKCLVY